MYFNYVPLPYFIGFTAFTPEVPKLYWNVKSQEQRILELCKEYHKLVCYADALAERMNTLTSDLESAMSDFETKLAEQIDAQNKAVSEALAAQDAKVSAQLSALKTYIDTRLDNIAEGMEIYDVTTGQYRSSMETMRRLYSALAFDNIGERGLVSEVAAMLDVEQMAQKTVYNIAWSNRDTITIDDQTPTIEGIN